MALWGEHTFKGEWGRGWGLKESEVVAEGVGGNPRDRSQES